MNDPGNQLLQQLKVLACRQILHDHQDERNSNATKPHPTDPTRVVVALCTVVNGMMGPIQTTLETSMDNPVHADNKFTSREE